MYVYQILLLVFFVMLNLGTIRLKLLLKSSISLLLDVHIVQI